MRANFDLFENEETEGAESELQPKSSYQIYYNGEFVYSMEEGTNEVFGEHPLFRIRPPSQHDLKHNFLGQVGRTISKTHTNIKRSQLIHLFYIIALPLYTVLGAAIFKYLEGTYDDETLERFVSKCVSERQNGISILRQNCSNYTFDDCQSSIEQVIMDLDQCFRSKMFHPLPTHPMSNFANAVIFATSVYTTIGYGNIAANTFASRLATIIYAIFGIPLFFAFLKDMGQLFSSIFIKGWHGTGRLRRRVWDMRKKGLCFQSNTNNYCNDDSRLPETRDKQANGIASKVPPNSNFFRKLSSKSTNVREQRKVFIWAVAFFIVYLFAVSWLFCAMEKSWNFFESFYFLFTSVALVGFGDVFPETPSVVLINFAFIVLGIVLFGMCYFILQEEIREKAHKASRRVRNSIFRKPESRSGPKSGPKKIRDLKRLRKRSSSLDPGVEQKRMFWDSVKERRRRSAPQQQDLQEWSTTV